MGAVATILGATLPVVVRQFDWPYSVAGYLLAGNAAGYFLSSILSGWGIPRVGIRPLLCLGLLIQCGGVAAFGWSSQWWLNLILLSLVGVGQGMLEVSANCTVIQLDGSGRSRLMNLMHSAFTIGAVLAPLLVGIVLENTIGWRKIYVAGGIASGALACLTLCFQFPEINQPTKVASGVGIFKDRFLVLCWSSILLYVGIEMGVSSWIGEYYVVFASGSAAAASMVVALFWGGILFGRLTFGLQYHGTSHRRVLVVSSGISALGLIGVSVYDQGGLFYSSVLLSGLGQSVFYPTVMVVVGEAYRHNRGLAIGVVASGGGIGAFFFPLIVGSLADREGLRVGFYFFGAMSLTLLLLSVFMAVFARPRS